MTSNRVIWVLGEPNAEDDAVVIWALGKPYNPLLTGEAPAGVTATGAPSQLLKILAGIGVLD